MSHSATLKTCILLILFTAVVSRAQEWVQIAEFDNGNAVRSLLETSDGVLFAGNLDGYNLVYKSIDHGVTWTSTGTLAGGAFVSDIVAPSSDMVMVSATCQNDVVYRGCVFRSTDEGITWNETALLEDSKFLYDLYLTSDGTLLAGTHLRNEARGMIFKSTDNGDSWSQTVLPEGVDLIRSFVETSDGVLLAGGSLLPYGGDTAVVLRSPDGGENWYYTAQPEEASSVMCLLETPAGTVLAGTTNDGILFATTNEGGSWTSLATLGDSRTILTLMEASDGTLYAGTGQHESVFFSTNGGQSWQQTSGPYGVDAVYSILETSDHKILVGIKHDEAAIFEKCDGCSIGNICYEDGQVNPVNTCQYCSVSESTFHWTENPEAGCLAWVPTTELDEMSHVMDIIEPEPGQILAVGSIGSNWNGSGCVFQTDDYGTSWQLLNQLSYRRRFNHIFQSSTDDTLYISGNSGSYDPYYPYEFYSSFWSSSNGGITWDVLGEFHGTYKAYDSIQTSDGTLVVGTADEARVYFSQTGGDQWVETGPLTEAYGVYTLLEDPDGSIYAGTSYEGDVYKTTNGGNTWENTGELADAWHVETLLHDNDGAILAGANDGQIFRTTDGGQTWDLAGKIDGMGIINSIVFYPENIMWVGTNEENVHDDLGAVFYSEDDGETWTGMYGLGYSELVNILFVGSDGYLYAGTSPYGRVYKACPGCRIEDQCYLNNQTNPDNPCQICLVSESLLEWSNQDGVACDDGNLCTEDGTCQEGECVSEEVTVCDDLNPCTDDRCDPATGECMYDNNSVSCDDGIFCNGEDVCRNALCTHSGDPCQDDLFCNGAEICNEDDKRCVRTGSPCEEDETCNEEQDVCESDENDGDDDDDDDCGCNG